MFQKFCSLLPNTLTGWINTALLVFIAIMTFQPGLIVW